MRFREKTYIVTLLLFLLFLNTGIFSLAFYTYERNAESANEVCYAEETVIAEAYENDLERLGERNAYTLIKTYGEFYAEKDICLELSMNDHRIYSTLPSGITAPRAGYSATQRSNGRRYFLVTEQLGNYNFTYAKDVSYLDEDFKHISIVFVLTSLGASALLAVCLFFALRKLSSPLESLSKATQEIANGNFNTRADDSGSDEFSLLASDFNRMAQQVRAQIEELELSTRQKQEMLDNLAHEMRTPLTSIRGYAEFLRDANIPDREKTESLEYIISEAERLRSISEKLLDEAFIRENGITPEHADLGGMIADSARSLSLKAASLGVALKTETSECYINCDRLLINLLITNLAENAIKACRENGTVTIGCEQSNGKTTLYVADNGIGMTEEQIKHITEPFFRTDRSRSRSEGGTGLGLSLCARIAEAHNAELCFESEPQKGTKATLTFTTP